VEGNRVLEESDAPWDDTYTWVATYTVDPGYHWIEISTSWSDGPRPNDCSSQVATAKERYSTQARAELTIEIDPAQCKAAKKAASTWLDKVKSVRAQLRKATTTKAKEKLSAKLTTVKGKRARAVKRVTAVC
jgi:hypothetical protein